MLNTRKVDQKSLKGGEITMKKLVILAWTLTMVFGLMGTVFAADIDNYATATGTDLNSNALTIPTSNTTTSTYLGLPDISMTKAAVNETAAKAPSGRAYVIPGDHIEYTITVTNAAGSSSPASLTVMDLLPTNTIYDSVDALGGTAAAQFAVVYTNDAGTGWAGTLTDGVTVGNAQNGIGVNMTGTFEAIGAPSTVILTFTVEVANQ